MTKAVTRSTKRTLVVADMPFGSYEAGPDQALATAFRLMKEGGAQAVKLEGGIGGFRVQGRGAGAEKLMADAHAVQEAGAFAVVMEMVPAEIAGQVTKELTIPTIGIGAGVDCDAQVLVWPDMAGYTGGRVPKFVKKYADLRGELLRATREFADDVRGGTFPGPEHSFE
jgi:3-methyl-2-oxobutanoate hydroxymethyltransferase